MVLGGSCLPFPFPRSLGKRPGSSLHPPFSHLNFTPFSLPNLTRLNSCMGPSAASILEPLDPSNRPKIDSKSPLDASFVEKRDFSKKWLPPRAGTTFLTPRARQDRPKIGPRRLQDDLQELFFSSSFLTSILVHLQSHLGLILATFEAPKAGPS